MSDNRYWPPKAPGIDVDAPPPWRAFDSPATRWLRRVAAVALAASLFMPLTRCSGADDSAVNHLGDLPLALAALVVLAFVWPLVFELLARWMGRVPLERDVPLLRLMLAGGSVLTLAWLTCLRWVGAFNITLRYGVAVAVAALVAYLASLLVVLRRRRRARRGP